MTYLNQPEHYYFKKYTVLRKIFLLVNSLDIFSYILNDRHLGEKALQVNSAERLIVFDPL